MGVAPSEVHRNDSERELRHRAPLPALKGDTLWLDRRSPIIGLALHNGLICVNGGEWHGFYQTYQNVALREDCLLVCFGGKPPYSQASRFEDQIPHHLRPCGRHVYRNYNNEQMIIFGNIDYPLTFASSDVHGIEADPDGFHCQMADRNGDILSISFHWNGSECKQSNTLYGLLSGTTDVYRALGTGDPSNPNDICCDSRLSEMSHWHIVLLGTAVWHKCDSLPMGI